jgi:hypothetical protein
MSGVDGVSARPWVNRSCAVSSRRTRPVPPTNRGTPRFSHACPSVQNDGTSERSRARPPRVHKSTGASRSLVGLSRARPSIVAGPSESRALLQDEQRREVHDQSS